MGGRLISTIFESISEFVDGIVLISSGFPLSRPKDRFLKRSFEQLAIEKASFFTPYDFCSWWYSLPIYSSLTRHSSFNSLIKLRASQFQPKIFCHCIDALSALHMPMTLFNHGFQHNNITYIFGQLDTKYARLSQYIRQQYKHINVLSIPNTSHLCWVESPDKVQHSIHLVRAT